MSLMDTPTAPPLAGTATTNQYTNPWTDDRLEKLIQLWTDGESASQIMAQLDYPFSRSAILGKVHRLGLSKRVNMDRHVKYGGAIAKRADSFRRAPRPKQERPAKVKIQTYVSIFDKPAFVARTEAACSLFDLTDISCRFPLGEPGEADFAFCGQTVNDPRFGVYCAGHCRIAYQPRGEG